MSDFDLDTFIKELTEIAHETMHDEGEMYLRFYIDESSLYINGGVIKGINRIDISKFSTGENRTRDEIIFCRTEKVIAFTFANNIDVLEFR